MPESPSAPRNARATLDAQEAFMHAIAAVDPTKRVKAHVRTGAIDDWLKNRDHPETLHVLALGKAAARMTWGLVEANVPFRGLGVHPGGVPVPNWEGFQWIKGNHPTPGPESFAAGTSVWDWFDNLPPGAPVLVLLSGGASSLLERPKPNETTDELVAHWTTDLQAGLPIDQLNNRRATRSSLKAGGLAHHAKDHPLRVWLICDVPPNQPEVVASGPFWNDAAPQTIPHTVLAHNDDAVQAAGAALQAKGYNVYLHPTRIQGDASEEAKRFVDLFASLEGERVALVGGGEPTIRLPTNAPPGGRGQHASLAAARALHDQNIPATFIAGATDGRDGVDVAAAWSDQDLWNDDAAQALQSFNAHRFLTQHQRTIKTGATGTNVADVWMLLDHDAPE